MSRETGSIPPITVLNNDDDDDDDGSTLTSIDTETEQDIDDVEEQLKTSGNRSVHAPQAKLNEAGLIPDPGFPRIRSWQRVPVPEGRGEELAKVKVRGICHRCDRR